MIHAVKRRDSDLRINDLLTMSKRAKELTTTGTRWRRKIWNWVSVPFSGLSEDQRFWIGFSVLCLLTTLLINNPIWRASGEQTYKEGDIARESIISPADIHFIDEEGTDRNRQAVRDAVLPIFVFEPNRADEAVQSFRSAWENLRRSSDISQDGNRGNSNVKTEDVWTGLEERSWEVFLRPAASVQMSWTRSSGSSERTRPATFTTTGQGILAGRNIDRKSPKT